MNKILKTSNPRSVLHRFWGGLFCAVFVYEFQLAGQNGEANMPFPPAEGPRDMVAEERGREFLLTYGAALEQFLEEGNRLWDHPRFADAALKLNIEISGVYGRDDLLIARLSQNEIKVIARSFQIVHSSEGKTPPSFRSETHDLSLLVSEIVPETLMKLIDECSQLKKPVREKEAYLLDSLGLMVRCKTKDRETRWAMQLAGMEKGSDVDRIALGILRTIEELAKIDLWKKGD